MASRQKHERRVITKVNIKNKAKPGGNKIKSQYFWTKEKPPFGGFDSYLEGELPLSIRRLTSLMFFITPGKFALTRTGSTPGRPQP